MRSETAIGPAPGPPPPCGCVNVLCRLKCTMSKPMSPGPRAAHDRVEVRAVVVQRRADAVDDLGDLLDVAVEHAERVRVGEHQAGDVLVGLGAQVLDVDAAVLVGADLDDLVAAHRHRRRVGAVRGVGGEDLRALVAAVLVVGAREQHAGELAVASRRDGCSETCGRPATSPSAPCSSCISCSAPWARFGALQRVQARVARQRRDALVQLRVVLHRARAERVEAGVEVEVALGQPVVVADDLRLGDLRQLRRLRAAEPAPAARAWARRARAPRTRAGRAWTSRRSSSRGRAACRSRRSRCGADAARGLRCPDRRGGGSRRWSCQGLREHLGEAVDVVPWSAAR